MRKIILSILLIFFLSSCVFTGFDNINDYQGSIILDIPEQSWNSCINLYIQSIEGEYIIIVVRSDYGSIFSIGDTI